MYSGRQRSLHEICGVSINLNNQVRAAGKKTNKFKIIGVIDWAAFVTLNKSQAYIFMLGFL